MSQATIDEKRAERLLYWQRRVLESEREMARIKKIIKKHNAQISKQSIASVYRIEI